VEGLERYAVVSCHVERPLDDRVWSAFERFLRRRPAGFVVTPFLRPPDADFGEEEALWLERARRVAGLAPLGHHTHWGGPTQARPLDGDAAERVRREAGWLRANGLEPRFFCGGGWYLDPGVAAVLADLGYVDCTATAFRQSYLAEDAARLSLPEPARLRLDDGRVLLELPATHSIGMLARSVVRALPPTAVHVHFHDWELADRRRTAAIESLLRALRVRRKPLSVDALADRAADAREVSWAEAAATLPA
jgi:hypothetical protein